ncbi:hypothetical protein D6D54_03305 [Spiroplasma poulsonii]|uniref:Uncharacterized protein n=1 Tax=Spiroplasma poulsonii TaxID=2138 RepID=A0A3S0SZ42_9MOLU|nr:hypothetical protein [Spiroplasma poulsonii]MBW3058303.1 hypothetical protein [Spiroplasma poulsonii]RUP77588.1 hypothetical protein D6D54_03305 [Spiroplasma poulsonii]
MKHLYFNDELYDLFNSPATILNLPARVFNIFQNKFERISFLESKNVEVRHIIQSIYIFTENVRNVGNKTMAELTEILKKYNLKIFTSEEIIEIYNYEYANNKWFLFKNKEDTKYFKPYKNWRQLILTVDAQLKMKRHKKN